MGRISAGAAEEKIDFFENGSRRGDSGHGPEFWREDSVRGIGARISIEGRDNVLALKCLCQSALCKNDSPAAGNRFCIMRRESASWVPGCQKISMIICAEISLRRTNDATHYLSKKLRVSELHFES